MRPKVVDIDVADADLTGFASNVTGASFTLTTTATPDGLAHKVSIRNDSANDHSGKTVTLVGTDAQDQAQTEVVTGPGVSATVESTKYFKTLTSATPSATIGSDTFDIGWADEVVSRPFLLNHYAETAATVSVDVTGTLDFTVEETCHDRPMTINATQDAPWSSVTALAGKTADTTAQVSKNATAVRVKLNSYSSGAELQMRVLQSY